MAMRPIVITCKGITEEVENYEQRKDASMKAEDKSNLYACKSKLSATLTNLMTAAKNHATGYGISPVSLLDAAAGHLTATLVDLVKVVKLRREHFKVPPEPIPVNNYDSEIPSLETKNSQDNGSETMGIDQLKVNLFRLENYQLIFTKII